jgi:hypothetical protein
LINGNNTTASQPDESGSRQDHRNHSCNGHLEQLGIVKELTARKHNRLFSYAGYIEIMRCGTELPGG